MQPWLHRKEQGRLQKTLSTKVFVNIRPVDSVPSSGNAPIRPLLRRSVPQTRIPGQGDRYGPSVEKINTNRVVSDTLA